MKGVLVKRSYVKLCAESHAGTQLLLTVTMFQEKLHLLPTVAQNRVFVFCAHPFLISCHYDPSTSLYTCSTHG